MQDYGSGLLFPPLGDLPDLWIEPTSPELADSLPLSPLGSPNQTVIGILLPSPGISLLLKKQNQGTATTKNPHLADLILTRGH